MECIIREITDEDIAEIKQWHYEAPYDVYDGLPQRACEDAWRALCGEDGSLQGYLRWGPGARLKGAEDLYEAEPGRLDVGISLRPELTGQGMGAEVAECALRWLYATHHPASFRMSVYAWNGRAHTVWKKIGFEKQALYGDFYVMVRDSQ